jgi:hypothetical protein
VVNINYKRIIVTSKLNGDKYYFHSIRSAAKFLDINTRRITKIVSYPCHSTCSSTTNCFLSFIYRDESAIIHEGYAFSKNNSVFYPGVHHNEIPIGEI